MQVSTVITKIFLSGYNVESSPARAMLFAPPAQPSPIIGIRFTSVDNPSKSMSLASRVGVTNPELVTTIIISISLGSRFAFSMARRAESVLLHRH